MSKKRAIGKRKTLGKRERSLSTLRVRKVKLEKILNSGVVEKNGSKTKISELEIEKYGHILDRTDNEILRLSPVVKSNSSLPNPMSKGGY